MNGVIRPGRPGLRSGELARKTVHIGAGLLALLVPYLTWWQGVLCCAGGLALNGLLLPLLTRRRLERDEDRARGYAAGILLYPIGVAILFILFGSRPAVVAGAWGILAFGDGFATLAGRTLGGPRLPWNQDKTVSGWLAFVAVGSAAGLLLGRWAEPDPSLFATVLPAWAFVAAAILAGFVESLPTGLNDNLSVPVMAGALLFALAHMDPALLQQQDTWARALPWAAAVNTIIALASWRAHAVRPSGAVAGWIIGTVVFAFGGWQAFVILLLFFVLGTGATRVGYDHKKRRRLAQEDGGRRGARHAVANCGLPAFLAFLAAASPAPDIVRVALVAALATAVFDTVSSEIGQVYGRRPFLITTLRPVPAGTEGAISVEGTLAGAGAAAVLAVSGLSLGLMGSFGAGGSCIVVAAAFTGAMVESYLGASPLFSGAVAAVDNEALNFANTLVGALTAVALCTVVMA
jgi:uncharacterized protein (TIGR00297 family)